MVDRAISSSASVLATNKLIRNTYMLLSMTLLFSALAAYVSMQMKLPPFGILITLGGFFGLLFVTNMLRNSPLGLVAVFAFTGFMGLTLGPLLNAYIGRFANGHELIMTAMGGTAVIFLGLSAYALNTRKDFSFMGGFLMVGVLTAFIAGLAAYFLQMPALSLAVSGCFILLMSGVILYETSSMIHGGETNYIMATVSLFVAIFNLFVSLLHILGALTGED